MAEKAKVTEKPVAETPVETIVKETDANDQKMKELTLRLLWQASRIVKGATYREINFEMPKIREWVGTERAEQLELKWRKGTGN